MEYKTFEEYLQVRHAKDYHGTDDDMPEAYEAWLVDDLQIDDLINYANLYAHLMYSDGFQKAKEIALDVINK